MELLGVFFGPSHFEGRPRPTLKPAAPRNALILLLERGQVIATRTSPIAQTTSDRHRRGGHPPPWPDTSNAAATAIINASVTTPAATATAPSARIWPALTKCLEQRKDELLPIDYYHLVFTIPEPLNALVLQNKALFYRLLFETSAATLQTIAADPQHLSAQIGFFSILHTWASTPGPPHLGTKTALSSPHPLRCYRRRHQSGRPTLGRLPPRFLSPCPRLIPPVSRSAGKSFSQKQIPVLWPVTRSI